MNIFCKTGGGKRKSRRERERDTQRERERDPEIKRPAGRE